MKTIFGIWSLFAGGYASAIVVDFAGWGDFRDSLNLGNFGNALVLLWLIVVGVYFIKEVVE